MQPGHIFRHSDDLRRERIAFAPDIKDISLSGLNIAEMKVAELIRARAARIAARVVQRDGRVHQTATVWRPDSARHRNVRRRRRENGNDRGL